jgi:hypothetical protein
MGASRDGATVSQTDGDCPLPWLQITVDGTSLLPSFSHLLLWYKERNENREGIGQKKRNIQSAIHCDAKV